MKALLTLLMLVLFSLNSQAQKKSSFEIRENQLVITLAPQGEIKQLKTVLEMADLSLLNLDSLLQFGSLGPYQKESWIIKKNTPKEIILVKSLEAYSEHEHLILEKEINQHDVNPPSTSDKVVIGQNNFEQVTVKSVGKNLYLFYLPGKLKAKKVVLSGSFNDWSVSKDTMSLTDSGWIIQKRLVPGKYFYKYIVDGKWMTDPFNRITENDGHYNNNSVFYAYNKRFLFRTNQKFKQVYLAGSFNNWQRNELEMFPRPNGWEISLYLKEGSYTYKFVADGNWFLDPDNPDQRPDGEGNVNSFTSSGDTHRFFLPGYLQSKKVFLCGSFNRFRTEESPMTRTDSGWVLDYALAPGFYTYKFLIDGKEWVFDPINPLQARFEGELNSAFSFKPNHYFKIKQFPNAQQILVTGSFIDWSKEGIPLSKSKDQVWSVPVFLGPGKHTYKYIVDGEWITDPSNPHWENNEYGTGNSVLWIGKNDL